MPKIFFHPQSISNKYIHFENGEGDKIRYSYTGTFTKRGVDYEEISLPVLYKMKNIWNPTQMNNTTHEQKDREELALRFKYIYVERNFHALNAIINTKNQIINTKNHALIQADKQWASNHTLIKIARFVLKLFTCCQFDLLAHLHRKYEHLDRNPRLAPLNPKLATHQIVPSGFVQIHLFYSSITHENNKKFLENFQVKGKPQPANDKEKWKQIKEALKELIQNPQGKFEDYFFLSKEMPGFDFESLYRMDLPNCFHSPLVNGHMVDPGYVQSPSRIPPIPDDKNGRILSDYQRNFERFCS